MERVWLLLLLFGAQLAHAGVHAPGKMPPGFCTAPRVLPAMRPRTFSLPPLRIFAVGTVKDDRHQTQRSPPEQPELIYEEKLHRRLTEERRSPTPRKSSDSTCPPAGACAARAQTVCAHAAALGSRRRREAAETGAEAAARRAAAAAATNATAAQPRARGTIHYRILTFEPIGEDLAAEPELKSGSGVPATPPRAAHRAPAAELTAAAGAPAEEPHTVSLVLCTGHLQGARPSAWRRRLAAVRVLRARRAGPAAGGAAATPRVPRRGAAAQAPSAGRDEGARARAGRWLARARRQGRPRRSARELRFRVLLREEEVRRSH
jgi:hypothetical protein